MSSENPQVINVNQPMPMQPAMMSGNDHDLLIRISTQFETYQLMSTQQWNDLHNKMNRFLTQVESKADKKDVQQLENKMTDLFGNLSKRLGDIEDRQQNENTKKQTIINLGAAGYKFWLFLSGFILFLLTIIKALKP